VLVRVEQEAGAAISPVVADEQMDNVEASIRHGYLRGQEDVAVVDSALAREPAIAHWAGIHDRPKLNMFAEDFDDRVDLE
jgi:hypothetical protein